MSTTEPGLAKINLPKSQWVVIACAIMSIIIGSLVIIGWHTNTTELLSILPIFVAMQYNTALGFLLCGLGLLFFHKTKISFAFGALASILGILSLSQYIFGINFHIDQLFMDHYITAQTSHPGRMAPNTALCFTISGITLLIGTLKITFWQRESLLILLSTIIIILGTVALCGYIVGVPTSYGWGHLTRMAVHTSIGFIFVGIGLLTVSLELSRMISHAKQNYLPLLTLVIGAAVMTLIWQLLLAKEHNTVAYNVNQALVQIKDHIQQSLNFRIDGMNSLGDYWETRHTAPTTSQLESARTYFRDASSAEGIAYVDKNGTIHWLHDVKIKQSQTYLETVLKEHFKKDAITESTRISPPILLDDGTSIFYTYHDLVFNNKTEGTLVGVFHFQPFIDIIVPKIIRENWDMNILHDNKPVYVGAHKDNELIKERWAHSAVLDENELHDSPWVLEVWPTKNALKTFYSWAPTIIFIIGLFVSALIALLVQLWINISKAKEEADSANKAKSQFLSSMSHELRTPLNAILGYAQLFELNKSLAQKEIHNAKLIRKAGTHLLSLINDILDLSRIESGKTQMSIESVSFEDIMEECVSLTKPLTDKYNVTFHFDALQNQDIYIEADFFRLKQIMLNLISNAMKYNRPAGKVTVFTEQKSDNRISIAVKDTGMGIPPEKLKDMFQPFQRLGAERSNIEGTGIGLVITKDLIELMGGKIWVESEVDHGTTVWISLKSSEKMHRKREAKLQQELESKSIEKLAHSKILLVEDNPVNQEIVTQQLEFLNLDVDVASDGEEGCTFWQVKPYDLILMDCNMPKRNGYEATEWIRKHEKENQRIPIIGFTANAFQQELDKCITAGMDDYIVKPVDIELLKSKLQDWLSKNKSTLADVSHRKIKSPPQTSETKTPEPANDASMKDAPGSCGNGEPIDMAVAEKYVGKDPALQTKIFNKFIDSSKHISDDLHSAYTKHETDEIRMQAHKLKSSAKAVGAVELSALCLAIETAAKEDDWDDIHKLEPKLASLIQQVEDFIHKNGA